MNSSNYTSSWPSKEANPNGSLLHKVSEEEEPSEIISFSKFERTKREQKVGLLDFKKMERSTIFWNCMLLLPLGILGYLDLRLLGLVLFVGSIFSIGIFFDRYKKIRLWMLYMPATWLLIGFYAVLLLVRKLADGIESFNRVLDKK